ncbi:hypothetical protein [Actinomadura madurae]|uniref:hypothetical protein n=1 Tax=Actinomadura madurae TaxID=1993 RepID=UPI0020D21712|nr:hypothetical protein [Actinomadura madurae]MCP9966053.1 hypothetical protein [Actinomadura madurae]MCQ0009931.1 hypothetical protein [Actinomadura madurae]MCQ0014743.1 hypothetical protein [Actinomadura madurae]
MALDRDGFRERTDRPPQVTEPPPPPPDRPGAPGAPSRAASRAAAQVPDRPSPPDVDETDEGPSRDDDPGTESDDPPGDDPDSVSVPDEDDAVSVPDEDDAVSVPDEDAPDRERPEEPAAGTGREAASDDGRGREPEPPRPADENGAAAIAEKPATDRSKAAYPHVTDQSGYVFTDREYAFAGVSPDEVRNMKNRRAPLGIRPEQWDECVAELREALASDGLTDVAVRLGGSSVRFCSDGPGKWFPQSENDVRIKVAERHRNTSEEDRAQRAEEAVAKYRAAGFSRERPRPFALFFDSQYRLGIADAPDGYDFQIDGDGIAEAEALRAWAERWKDELGRGVTLTETGVREPELREDDCTVIDPEDGAESEDGEN